MDAEDSVLVKRYKESRRSHPLARTGRVDEGIRLEREKTKFLRKRADYIIRNNTNYYDLEKEILRVLKEAE